jgi:hypothetical protein
MLKKFSLTSQFFLMLKLEAPLYFPVAKPRCGCKNVLQEIFLPDFSAISVGGVFPVLSPMVP